MLIKNDDTLQQFATLSEGTFNDVRSLISSVEDKHLVPILGLMQYEELNAALATTPEADLSAKLKNLLEYCRKVIGPWVCVYFTPKTEVKVSGAGARRMETESAKTAYQYQTRNFIAANREEAMDAQENLLAFLEEKKADYPLWVAGPGNKAFNRLFIRTAKEFNELFTTPAPHSNFWSVKSKMVDIEEITLPRAIGTDLFKTIKTKTLTGFALTDEEKELLYACKKAIAAFAVADALPFIHLRLAEDGATSGGGGSATNDNYTSRVPATDTALTLFKNSASDLGRTWLAKAQQIIKENPVAFPTAAAVEQPNSKPLKSVFGLR